MGNNRKNQDEKEIKRAHTESGKILYSIYPIHDEGSYLLCIHKEWLKAQMRTLPQSDTHFRPLQTDERSHDFRNICAYC